YLVAVATFYDMLETHPVGRRSVYVCTNISCSLCGADELFEAIRAAAGEDPEINVRAFECLGACDIAPMASVDGVYVGPLPPEEVLAELEASEIRGRGGAGFQMGKKASFLPKGTMDKYLVCNADESEPGTFKDRELMQKSPHMLIEGIVIAAYAAGINRSFIYIRGEYEEQAQILDEAIAEAYAAGYVGERIVGSEHSMSLVLP